MRPLWWPLDLGGHLRPLNHLELKLQFHQSIHRSRVIEDLFRLFSSEWLPCPQMSKWMHEINTLYNWTFQRPRWRAGAVLRRTRCFTASAKPIHTGTPWRRCASARSNFATRLPRPKPPDTLPPSVQACSPSVFYSWRPIGPWRPEPRTATSY